jgi:hypothetical protein
MKGTATKFRKVAKVLTTQTKTYGSHEHLPTPPLPSRSRICYK